MSNIESTGVDTAVIMAAGDGTRRRPAAYVIEKAAFPIGNRIAIDYVVEQCVDAGIRNFVIVTKTENSQIKQYYDIKKETPHSEEWGWDADVNFRYVVQGPEHGYGTAAPLKAAREHLEGIGHFAVLAADNFLHNPKENPVKTLIAQHKPGIAASMLGLLIARDQTRNFGIIDVNQRNFLDGFVEKPEFPLDSRPPLANISYYLLDDRIFPEIDRLRPENGEYYLPMAVLTLSKHYSLVHVEPVTGAYMDVGEVNAATRATIAMTGYRP